MFYSGVFYSSPDRRPSYTMMRACRPAVSFPFPSPPLVFPRLPYSMEKPARTLTHQHHYYPLPSSPMPCASHVLAMCCCTVTPLLSLPPVPAFFQFFQFFVFRSFFFLHNQLFAILLVVIFFFSFSLSICLLLLRKRGSCFVFL